MGSLNRIKVPDERKTIMKPGNSVVSVRMMLFITLVLLTAMSGTAMSACIPEGAYVESATFSVYVTGWGQTVQLHRITAPWLETEVTWNNFGGTYAPDVAGSLTAPKGGEWRSVDVTALVQGWVDGSYPNYGVLLEQDQANAITFASSENTPVDRRPKLQITYVTLDGSASVTIQRPGADQDGVADAYISARSPDRNGGNANPLYAGLINNLPKQSLVRFELEFCDEPAGGCRFTGGGVDTDENWDHTLEDGQMIRNGAGSVPEGIDRAQFGGQAVRARPSRRSPGASGHITSRGAPPGALPSTAVRPAPRRAPRSTQSAAPIREAASLPAILRHRPSSSTSTGSGRSRPSARAERCLSLIFPTRTSRPRAKATRPLTGPSTGSKSISMTWVSRAATTRVRRL